MKKLLCFMLSCTVILSSFFIFDIISLGSGQVSVDEFSADVADLISKFGMEPESPAESNPDYYNAGLSSQSEFETCRVIVKSTKPVDPLNAVAVVSGFEELQIMQFESPQDAEAAYEYYITLDCVEFAEPDKIIEVASESEEYPYDYKTKYISWGPEYIAFDELNDYIVENNLELSPVTVAIIDSGINHSRPEFEGRIDDSFFNNTGSGGSDDTTDENGHGTHVASVITDCTFSNVIIRPYKVFDSKGKSTSILIASALFTVCSDNCDIINMSFGQSSENFTVTSAVEYVHEKTNPLMVAAIGNEGTNEEEIMPVPAISEHVIAVSSINNKGILSSFSNYSKKHVELTAPGERINGASKNNNYAFVSKSGTSQATPFVVSVAAAAKSFNPSADTQQIRALLNSTAIPLGTDRENLGFFGSGLVYAMGVLNLLPDRKFAQAPVFSHESGKYEKALSIKLTCEDGAKIYYTTDGTVPNENSSLYSGEFTVDDNAHILAAAYVDGKIKSPVACANYRFVKTADSSMITVDDNGFVTSFSSDYSDIRIPETAVSVSGNQVTVKGIGEGVFKDNLYLISVDLPDTVQTFKAEAFSGCLNLEEINLSAAVNIGDGAFNLCREIKSISIPNAVSIGSRAFYEAGAASGNAFSLSLEKLEYLGDRAFTSTLLTHFYAPVATGSIGSSAFENCSELVEVFFPNASSVGNSAFANCVKLTDSVFDLAGSVGNSAFLNCKNLKSLSLESAESIGSKAFGGCTALADFSLPAVKTIFADCFADIPATVTELVLPSLETITEVEGASFPASITSFFAPKLKNIPSNAFKNNTLLSEITLGSAETIGNYAFYQCTSLTEIDLSTVKSIGAYAFAFCKNIGNVDLSSLRTLGEYSFNNCSKLCYFNMPEVESIGNFAFSGTRIYYISAPKATSVSLQALSVTGSRRTLLIDLSSLKSINFYNFFTGFDRSYIVLSSLESGSFYAPYYVYLSPNFSGTCYGSRQTDPVIFETLSSPGYSHLPESASVTDVLYVSAAGINLSYQWYSSPDATTENSTVINGATSAELDLLTAPDALYYYCKVTMNNGSATSSVCSSFVRNSSYLGGAERADYSRLTAAVDAVPANLDNFTSESVEALNSTLGAVNSNLPLSRQNEVDSVTRNILSATDGLQLKRADYTAVDDQLKKVPADLSIYTPESAAAVRYAAQSVEYGFSVLSQARVDCMALRIADKLSRLEIAPADYSELDTVINSIPNLEIYTEESVTALEEILGSIDRNLKITEQDKVGEYTKALKEAISALIPKSENFLKLEEMIKSAPQNLSNYTDSSANHLRDVLNEVESGKISADSQQIDEYLRMLTEAIENLKLKSADYSELDSALENVPEDLSIYTDESVAALNSAIAAVEKNHNITQQNKVAEYANAISNAIKNLKLKPADYSELDSALENVPEDLSIYTDESVAALNSAIAAVEKNYNITQQNKVAEYANTISNAVKNLKLKTADYSELNSALENVPEDLSIYTDESVAALNSAIAAVENNLDITQQNKVDGYTDSIKNAVAALVLKKSDLSGLNNAIALVPSDLSVYTEESVAALHSVLDGIDYERAETEQEYADSCAESVNKAIENLELEHWFIRLIKSIIKFFKNLFKC